MSDCLTYVIINFLWLCMLSYAWMRERFRKKKEKKRKTIGQEDQMLELIFDSPSDTFNLSFSKINSPHSLKEKQKKNKEKEKGRKIKENEVKERKRRV